MKNTRVSSTRKEKMENKNMSFSKGTILIPKKLVRKVIFQSKQLKETYILFPALFRITSIILCLVQTSHHT